MGRNTRPVSATKTDCLPTPVFWPKLAEFLHGYCVNEATYIISGFSQGFRICCDASSISPIFPPNHNSVVQNPAIVLKMLEKEKSKNRIAGPFCSPPFPNFIVSPLGLVPKKEKGCYRMIHDLSFPKNNSVNSSIDKELTSVHYESLDHVISLIKKFGQFSLIGKTDIEEAFRLLPIHPQDYHLLGFQFNSKFYYDRCLPMGCAIAPKSFERFSYALQWVMQTKFEARGISHILDDFIFIGPGNTTECLGNLTTFLDICQQMNIPIKHSKTVLPARIVTVHGVELDTNLMEARLPADKVSTLHDLLVSMSKKKKCTLKEIQSLVGYLNFACKVKVPGRVFKRRISRLTVGVEKHYHHIRLNKDFRQDVAMWLEFLVQYNGRSMFLDDMWNLSSKLEFQSDASGFGGAAVFGDLWCHMSWPSHWASKSIAVLEPIVVGIELWAHFLINKKVIFLVDNECVVEVLNAQSSKDEILLCLLRRLVLLSLKYNFIFKARHLPGIENTLADSLSRSKFQVARRIKPTLAVRPSHIGQHQLPWNWN